ncbi:hypothetical protein [Paenibacillus sp. HB172176]|uniref:hypothetical protein n=1 Tax=Paenibacillus sp. HB172176 TaxID=2493690 RepID=UPI00143AC5DA|nr:hypothetical protein [Paenibacillus sp. HB172176]
MIFTYSLTSIGWADIHLKIAEEEIYIFPSYLSEPLVDLVKSIEQLIPEYVPAGELKQQVQFDMDSEPAIHTWKIDKINEDKIEIIINCYEDGIKTLPGKQVFKGQCYLNDFITVVVQSMELLLENHGFIGYQKQWYGQDFPISSYLQLKYYSLNKSNFPTKITNPNEWIEKIETDLFKEIRLIVKGIL